MVVQYESPLDVWPSASLFPLWASRIFQSYLPTQQSRTLSSISSWCFVMFARLSWPLRPPPDPVCLRPAGARRCGAPDRRAPYRYGGPHTAAARDRLCYRPSRALPCPVRRAPPRARTYMAETRPGDGLCQCRRDICIAQRRADVQPVDVGVLGGSLSALRTHSAYGVVL